jgi:hypothetical protein
MALNIKKRILVIYIKDKGENSLKKPIKRVLNIKYETIF